MAVGDSITAAFAARGGLDEARDISWSIGTGSSDQLTLPWMLGQYSSKVEGMSTKSALPNHIADLPHGDYHSKTDHLNAAESEGAVHRNSLVEQWGILTSKMGEYDDLDERWKVLTIWMTANDVCGKCDQNLTIADPFLADWVNGTETFIQNVTSTMKRVYINLVSTMQLSSIARLQRSKTYCSVLHQDIVNECGCVDKGNDTQLASLDANVDEFNRQLHLIAQRQRARLAAEGRKDIAVIEQPFLEGIGPQLDLSFISSLDCFHPSAEAHQLLAVGLWNSMLCTEGREQRCGLSFSKEMKPVCPNSTSTFYTGPDVTPIVPPVSL